MDDQGLNPFGLRSEDLTPASHFRKVTVEEGKDG